MDSLIEYSLNTPTNTSINILNSKIINMLKNDNIIGGGNSGSNSNSSSSSSYDISNCIVIIIGIILIIIGYYLYQSPNDWTSTDARVLNILCDQTSSSNLSKCNVNISYTINSIHYLKTISMEKSKIPSSSMITIYYQNSNPNIMRLYNFNYAIIGITLIVIGLFILIPLLFITNNSSSNILESIDSN